MIKKYILIVLSFMVYATSAYSCLHHSCNGSIEYAMGRYSDKTIKRLDEYKTVIEGLTESEKISKKIEVQKINQIDRLIARSVLENIYFKKLSHEMNVQKNLVKRYNIENKILRNKYEK